MPFTRLSLKAPYKAFMLRCWQVPTTAEWRFEVIPVGDASPTTPIKANLAFDKLPLFLQDALQIENLTHYGSSAFQQRKLLYFFNLRDRDKNGFLEENDFLAYGQAVIEASGLAEATDVMKSFRSDVHRWWLDFERDLDHNSDGRISPDEWLHYWSGFIRRYTSSSALDRESILEWIDESVRRSLAVQGLMMTDYISLPEYKIHLSALGVQGDLEIMFNRLDTNGDGKVSIRELCDSAREFWLGDDPSALGAEHYGPLPAVTGQL